MRPSAASILAVAVLTATAAVSDASADGYPDSWYFYGPQRPAALKQLEGRPAPELAVGRWVGGTHDLADFEGKVIVVDFWATWCGPCKRAIPKNVEMMRDYEQHGVVVLGVHDSKRGQDRIPAISKQYGINYPVFVDDRGRSTSAWKVRFWPTYAVVDRNGIVRAAGLFPDRVDDVVKELLAESGVKIAASEAGSKTKAKAKPAPDDGDAATDGVPRSLLEGNPRARRRLAALQGSAQPPAIGSTTWINSSPLDLEGLAGKIVVLDFWATWCPPCLASVPKMNSLHAKYADDGVVIIGVCAKRGAEKMKATAAKHEMAYPLCADTDGTMVSAYKVNGFPDYYVIDRQGRLRIADCTNNNVEQAIKMLLAEDADATAQ